MFSELAQSDGETIVFQNGAHFLFSATQFS